MQFIDSTKYENAIATSFVLNITQKISFSILLSYIEYVVIYKDIITES